MVSTVSGIIALWVVRVPLAYWMAYNWGKENLFFSYIVGWSVGILISGTYYLSKKWTSKQILKS